MKIHSIYRFAALFALSCVLVSGCGSDGTGPGDNNSEVGVWQATHLALEGSNAIAAGMGLQLTLSSSGSYTAVITNDFTDSCNEDPDGNCTNTGQYSATSTTLTLDPGSQNEETFGLSLTSSSMTLTGNIGDDATTIVFTRVS